MSAKQSKGKVVIDKSKNKNKKYSAVFYDDNNKKIKTINFGSKGADDYTITGDKAQRTRYLNRHSKRENWNDPMTAGALSRYILWGDSKNINTNIKMFKKKFKYN
jgi:hypothetical protein